MRLRNTIRLHGLFIAIFLIALFLRLYKLPQTTTFGRDQGIDFLTVRDMILTHKPTLLGIKVSIADFHQGPIYLYMLVPLFVLMHGNPLAGAYTAVVVAGLTLLILYAVMTKFFGKTAALLSSILFAVSPEFFREGTTPLYQHFVPLFLVGGIGLLLLFFELKNPVRKSVVMGLVGLMMGLSLELHFLAITSCIAIPIFLTVWHRKELKYLPCYGLGLVVGLSPTMAFEVRHQFLNTHLFWEYLVTPHLGGTARSIIDFLKPWVEGMAKWYGADNGWLGGLLLITAVAGTSLMRFRKQSEKIMHQLFIVTGVTTLVFELGLHSFEPHYALPVWTLLLMIAPLWLTKVRFEQRVFVYIGVGLLVAVNVFTVVRFYSTNHGYAMAPGWTLPKIEDVATIIADDAHQLSGVNVASLLDGDTRAYPLRYTLVWKGLRLDSEEKYPESKVLYVVTTRTPQDLENSIEWEVASFKPYLIGQQWDLENGIILYRLNKNSTGR